MQLTRSRIKTIVRVYKSDTFYRSTISLGLEQRPRIWFYMMDILFRIPDREISNSSARVHLYESISYTGIGGTKRIICLTVVPPAFNTSIVIR